MIRLSSILMIPRRMASSRQGWLRASCELVIALLNVVLAGLDFATPVSLGQRRRWNPHHASPWTQIIIPEPGRRGGRKSPAGRTGSPSDRRRLPARWIGIQRTSGDFGRTRLEFRALGETASAPDSSLTPID